MSDLSKVKIDITMIIAHGWVNRDQVFDTLLLASDEITKLEQENAELRRGLEDAIVLASLAEHQWDDADYAELTALRVLSNKHNSIGEDNE